MKEAYISTREVADLFNVTETTIKRWTDNGSLPCVKTLGGHRKYLLKEIEAFAREKNIPYSGVATPLEGTYMERLGYAVYSDNISLAVEAILEEALLGNRESIFHQLMYLVKNKKSFSEIVDDIIYPVMQKVGQLWENTTLGVEQEHLISDTIKTAITRLVAYLPRHSKNDIKVVCACCEGEYHDMGLQFISYELELSGYSVHYLGANTPFQSLINVIKQIKPAYICLSATTNNITKKEFTEGVSGVVKAARKTRSTVIAGGYYFHRFDKDALGVDAIVNSLTETISIIKNNKKKGN